MARRVDQERPDEGADHDEGEVLDAVQQRVPQGAVVERREVPGDEDAEPEGDSHGRPEQERERATQRMPACERCEQVAREEEHRQRPAYGDERERDAEIGDQHVLEHVRGLEVLLGDRVERRHDADDDDGDAGEEQRPARPRRELGPPPVEPPPPLGEERHRDDRAPEHERVERPRLPELSGSGRGKNAHAVTVALTRDARALDSAEPAEHGGELARARQEGGVPSVELDRLDAEELT